MRAWAIFVALLPGVLSDSPGIFACATPGQGSAAVRLFQHYVPHKITRDLLNRKPEHLSDAREARAVGSLLGFHVDSRGYAVYTGEGRNKVPGPVFISKDGSCWENAPKPDTSTALSTDIMACRSPGDSNATLSELTIINIDSQYNTLCPCAHKDEVCREVCPGLPPKCVFQPDAGDSDEFDNDLLINAAILIVLGGLVGVIWASS